MGYPNVERILSHLDRGQERILFVDESRKREEISYTQFATNIRKLAKKIHFVENCTVICQLSHNSRSLAAFLAIALAGGNVLPVTCDLPLVEIVRIAQFNNTKLLFIDNSFKDHGAEILDAADIQIINIEKLEENTLLNKYLNPKYTVKVTGSKLLLSTSGTTGDPKTMVLDWGTLFDSADAYYHYLNLPKQNRKFWNFLPLNYLGGIFNLFIIPIISYSTIYIEHQFDGSTFLKFSKVLEKENIDTLWIVPSILTGLDKFFFAENRVKHRASFYDVDICFIGTAPVNRSLTEKFERNFGIKFIENYGLSETTFISSDSFHNGKKYINRLLPWVDIKIIDKELYVDSPFMFDGYLMENNVLNIPEKWFPTGDIVSENDKKLNIEGRKKLIIKKGGVLINLVEIEKLIAKKCDSSLNFVAIPMKSEFYGEDYAIFIESLNVEKMHEAITKSLPKSKFPHVVITMDQLPRTRSGKVKRDLKFYEIK